jgi:hypothetical protein
MLTVIDTVPTELLDIDATQLYRVLTGPTLIHLPGRQPQPLFVSVLLHGNEQTGWLAIQKLLRHYRDLDLPRALSILIGNVRAARYRTRHLDDQPDYNRIWLGGDRLEHQMARQVWQAMADRSVFACIDIHNNTGLNPHYACVNRLEPSFLQLATLFGRTTVYFTTPKTVLSAAFAKLCPAVVVECGQPGLPYGVQHALDFVQACLHLTEFSQRSILPQDIDLFHTVAVVKVPEDVRFSFGDFSFGDFSFGDAAADLCFPNDIDRLNFCELLPGTLVALQSLSSRACLDVRDEDEQDVCDRYFYLANGEIRTKLPVMPSMLTLNTEIVRQDCLCYLMERYPLQSANTRPFV